MAVRKHCEGAEPQCPVRRANGHSDVSRGFRDGRRERRTQAMQCGEEMKT